MEALAKFKRTVTSLAAAGAFFGASLTMASAASADDISWDAAPSGDISWDIAPAHVA
ncbi:hypothetical protein OG589_00155 [Sphaerisporangium sp. NBC_01403]|uniref:hypothetical protein n=1 Tax=Sphaerisporangium sp. NBC_01403 TaxID=2903599 RepID=UPI00324A9C2F